MHVPKHSRHQFPRGDWYLEFFDGGRPWMFPCHGLRFCLRTVLVHTSFIPCNDLLQEIITMIIKAQEMSMDAPMRFFLWSSVSCRVTHLQHTFLYPKRSWTMSQIVPCERLNCSSNSLSNTRRLACTVSQSRGQDLLMWEDARSFVHLSHSCDSH